MKRNALGAVVALSFSFSMITTPASAGFGDWIKEKASAASSAVTSLGNTVAGKLEAAASSAVTTITANIKAAGNAVVKVVDKGVEAVKKAAGSMLDFARKVKEKVLSYAEELMTKIKDSIKEKVGTVLGETIAKLGYTLADIKSWNKGGKINDAAVEKTVLTHLSELLKPALESLVEKSVGKAFDLIMTVVDPGVATLIGSIGEIPLVGGVIAGGLTLAYSIGRTLLRSTVIEKVTDLVFTKLVGPMIEKGITAVKGWSKTVATQIDGAIKEAKDLFAAVKQ